jgi:MFS family permease
MTDTVTTLRPARPARHRAASPRATLAIVLTGQFMALLDASVVNVAAPSIHASLHASGAGLQLVIAGYVITYAVLLVTGARLGDIVGHRTMFLFGVALLPLPRWAAAWPARLACWWRCGLCRGSARRP